jgi:hypothetical protein
LSFTDRSIVLSGGRSYDDDPFTVSQCLHIFQLEAAPSTGVVNYYRCAGNSDINRERRVRLDVGTYIVYS